jgi:hypothetical protein
MVTRTGKHSAVSYKKAVAETFNTDLAGKSKRPLQPDLKPDLKQAAADRRVYTDEPKAAPTKFRYGRT